MNIRNARPVVLAILAACLLSACSHRSPPMQADVARPMDLGQPELVITVASMSELLGNPEAFHGRRVRVIGVADFQFGLNGGSYLYFSKEHRRNWTNEALRLDGLETAFPDELGQLPGLNAQYVVVEGVFRYQPLEPGAEGREGQIMACVLSCNGELRDINRIALWGMESEHRMDKHMQ